LGNAERRRRLARTEAGLAPGARLRLVAQLGERLAARGERLERAGRALTREWRAKLGELTRTLATLGPNEVLARGYAIVRDSGGQVLTRAEAAAKAAVLEVQFADGRLRARPERKGGGTRRAGPGPDQDQGTLL
jgi:exodeoxyribonuclease VII large subunit